MKNIRGTIFKWIIIIMALTFVCIRYKLFLREAINEMRKIPIYALLICVCLGLAYYMAEGMIISYMTVHHKNKLRLFAGIKCGLYCAFYKLLTLGSGAGIAQIYYYNCNGIEASKGTGMMIVQYTFMKITIGILGIISFIGLIIMKDASYINYSRYMLAGCIVIGVIITGLIIVSVSQKTTNFMFKFIYKLIKPKNRLYPKIQYIEEYILNLQTQGKELWSNKLQFINIVLLNLIKLVFWYSIPAIIFGSLGFDINIFACVAVMAVTNMLSGVMAVPAGIGALDFVFILFFGSLFKESEATATLIVYRFFTWIVPFFLGAIIVGLHSGKRKIKPPSI